MTDTLIEIVASYDRSLRKIVYSFSCPRCRFHNSWQSEGTARTKVAEHLLTHHHVQLMIEKSDAPGVVRSTRLTSGDIRRLLEDAARRILDFEKEKGADVR